eukprot:Tbor_TRINITY_DN4419_c0_g1::TRINITY_DN4419_c0_g1_i1::g.8021::m.8021
MFKSIIYRKQSSGVHLPSTIYPSLQGIRDVFLCSRVVGCTYNATDASRSIVIYRSRMHSGESVANAVLPSVVLISPMRCYSSAPTNACDNTKGDPISTLPDGDHTTNTRDQSKTIVTNKRSSSNVQSTIHKISTDKNLASSVDSISDEEISRRQDNSMYYLPRRFAYNIIFRGGRFWFPATVLSVLYCTPMICPTMVEWGIFAIACAAVQRLIVLRGVSSPWLAQAMLYSGSGSIESRGLPLKGQVAVVTGATGGIGKVVAEKLRILGATVIISHRPGVIPRTTDDDIKNGSDLRSLAGHKLEEFISLPLDLSDRSSVRSFVNKVKEQVNHVDILVNAAADRSVEFLETKYHSDSVVETNFIGPFLLTESLLPLIRRSTGSGVLMDSRSPLPQSEKEINSDQSSGNNLQSSPQAANPSGGLLSYDGGRIVYISCSSHANVGMKRNLRDVFNLYSEGTPERTALEEEKKHQELDNDGMPNSLYSSGVMYSASKVGNIYHTQSLHERRFSGLQFPKNVSAINSPGKTTSSSPASSVSTQSADGETNHQRQQTGKLPHQTLRPYTACCVVLRGKVSTNLNNKLDTHSILGKNRIADEIRATLLRQNPVDAAETVLDCCLRPDLVSGGMYSDCQEYGQKGYGNLFTGRSKRSSVMQRLCGGGILSALAGDWRNRQSVIGWVAKATRGYS